MLALTGIQSQIQQAGDVHQRGEQCLAIISLMVKGGVVVVVVAAVVVVVVVVDVFWVFTVALQSRCKYI